MSLSISEKRERLLEIGRDNKRKLRITCPAHLAYKGLVVDRSGCVLTKLKARPEGIVRITTEKGFSPKGSSIGELFSGRLSARKLSLAKACENRMPSMMEDTRLSFSIINPWLLQNAFLGEYDYNLDFIGNVLEFLTNHPEFEGKTLDEIIHSSIQGGLEERQKSSTSPEHQANQTNWQSIPREYYKSYRELGEFSATRLFRDYEEYLKRSLSRDYRR